MLSDRTQYSNSNGGLPLPNQFQQQQQQQHHHLALLNNRIISNVVGSTLSTKQAHKRTNNNNNNNNLLSSTTKKQFRFQVDDLYTFGGVKSAFNFQSLNLYNANKQEQDLAVKNRQLFKESVTVSKKVNESFAIQVVREPNSNNMSAMMMMTMMQQQQMQEEGSITTTNNNNNNRSRSSTKMKKKKDEQPKKIAIGKNFELYRSLPDSFMLNRDLTDQQNQRKSILLEFMHYLKSKNPSRHNLLCQFLQSPYECVFNKGRRTARLLLTQGGLNPLIARLLKLHRKCEEGVDCSHLIQFYSKIGLADWLHQSKQHKQLNK